MQYPLAFVADKALFPTAVFVERLPPPLPTVNPLIEASPVTVRVAKEGEPPVTAMVPLEVGKVRVGVPAMAGAEIVTEPDVSPAITMLAMCFPYNTTQR